VPNVRGSSGYGKSYLLLDNGAKREDSVKDIGSLLDWIATRPELDKSRVAVSGGSYGGFMVLATMAAYADRLRCGVDVVGISNFVTFLENTEAYRRDLRRAEYGDERDPEMRKLLLSISPMTNAARIVDPLFVVQGKNDPRVPFTEAEQIVATVRKNGTPVWYEMALDEGHGFQKKTNRDHYQNATILFLEEYLLK
jgi:dipeptidyl aminopeptidase/acylaminoacyl peptidase